MTETHIDKVEVITTINSEHAECQSCSTPLQMYVGHTGIIVGAHQHSSGMIAHVKFSDDVVMQYHQADLKQV
jgi:hypothetical protein